MTTFILQLGVWLIGKRSLFGCPVQSIIKLLIKQIGPQLRAHLILFITRFITN